MALFSLPGMQTYQHAYPGSAQAPRAELWSYPPSSSLPAGSVTCPCPYQPVGLDCPSALQSEHPKCLFLFFPVRCCLYTDSSAPLVSLRDLGHICVEVSLVRNGALKCECQRKQFGLFGDTLIQHENSQPLPIKGCTGLSFNTESFKTGGGPSRDIKR